ncbi:uncharacterized protein TNCV_1818341 [Trichonephila clavipes]|nr:uncharacterized protein TNCV_1818341 [Trichonephila clavipes]
MTRKHNDRFSKRPKCLTAFRCHSFTRSVSSRVIMWFKLLLPHQHYPLAAMVGKDGKLYVRLVDVGALLSRSKVYEFAKRFDHLVIQGTDVLPAHKPYPIMTQKLKLVTPAVVFNILNANCRLWPRVLPSVSMRALIWWRTLATCLWRVIKPLPSCMSKTLPTPIQSW